MPPKKKTNATGEQTNASTSDATLPPLSAFEDILDSRFKTQMKDLNEVVLKYNKSTQDELKVIQKSQDFLGNKFDELLKSFTLLQEENKQLKSENILLKKEVKELNKRMCNLEEEQENLNLYSRRDCLEFHGIPESHGENTDELVKRVGELVGVEVGQTDISVSHRLPTKRGRIPTIIAKFTKRSTRDKIYQAKGNLKTYNSSHIGLTRSSENMYINESLTQRAKELFYRVREFRRIHNFKYVWTKYGKPYLKKDEEARSISFGSAKDFDNFKASFT